MQFCKGFTNNHLPCTRKASIDCYCKTHSKNSREDCAICIDRLFDEEKLTCGHKFCRNCIYKWEEGSCPMCRKPMVFINHNKSVIIEDIKKNIESIDDDQRSGNCDPGYMLRTLDILVENSWLKFYDEKYVDIMVEYVAVCKEIDCKKFRKYSKILENLRGVSA